MPASEESLRRLARRLPEVLLAAVVLSWAAGTAALAIGNHGLYRTNAYDMGHFDQLLWLLSQGLTPYSTVMGVHALGDHASLLLYPLSLLYRLVPDARALLLVQALAVSSVAVPIFLVGKERGRPWLGLLAAAATLAHPGLQNLALFDFHPDSLASPLFAFALWAAAARPAEPTPRSPGGAGGGAPPPNAAAVRRETLCVTLGALAFLAKENFALTTLALGIWLLAHRRVRAGAVLSAASLAWFGLALYVVLPAYNGHGSSHLSRFSAYGSTLPEIVVHVLRHPGSLVASVLTWPKLRYAALLVAAFGPLPFLGWRYLLLAVPPLSLNLFSSFDAQWSGLYHYDALTVPALGMAAVHGLLAVGGRWTTRRLPVALAALAMAAGAWHVQRAWPLRRADYLAARHSPSPQIPAYERLLARIPEGASVSAQTHLVPHLTHRRRAFFFPNPFRPFAYLDPKGDPLPFRADWVLYDTRIPDDVYFPKEDKVAWLRGLAVSGEFRVVAEDQGVVLLARNVLRAGNEPPR